MITCIPKNENCFKLWNMILYTKIFFLFIFVYNVVSENIGEGEHSVLVLF